ARDERRPRAGRSSRRLEDLQGRRRRARPAAEPSAGTRQLTDVTAGGARSNAPIRLDSEAIAYDGGGPRRRPVARRRATCSYAHPGTVSAVLASGFVPKSGAERDC